jgi:hypothetical protein
MNARVSSAVAGSVAIASLAACGPSSTASSPTSSFPRTVNAVAGGCVAAQPLGPLLKSGAAHGTSTVLAQVKSTGKTVQSDDGYVYTELKVRIHRTLVGPKRGRVVTGYAIGGTRDGVTTSADPESGLAWSPTGEAFATLDPSTTFPNAFVLGSLPIIDSSVAFVDVGCFTSTGYPSHAATHPVVLLRSGNRTTTTVTYQASLQ